MNTYEYESIDNKYHFVTDNYYVYELVINPADRFFDQNCSSCKDIFELSIECLSHECPTIDYKVGATICTILGEFLKGFCNGIMYWCHNGDSKGYQREIKFDRWYDTFNSDEKIEIFSQQFCESDCHTYYLLADKGCANYPILVHDFNYRCSSCSAKPYQEEC